MRIFKKVLLILLFANILRIIPGCCKCDEDLGYMSFNRMDIKNIDNSGEWAMTSFRDTMPAAAVAFEIALFDSLGYYYYSSIPELKSIGINTAMAMKCDCAFPLQANYHLTSIKISTIFSLSGEIEAGADVTSLFVGRSSGNSSSGNSVYQSLPSIIRQTEGKIYYDGGVESFHIFLQPEVENTSARFVIDITLSDNSIFSDTTNLIQILR